MPSPAAPSSATPRHFRCGDFQKLHPFHSAERRESEKWQLKALMAFSYI